MKKQIKGSLLLVAALLNTSAALCTTVQTRTTRRNRSRPPASATRSTASPATAGKGSAATTTGAADNSLSGKTNGRPAVKAANAPAEPSSGKTNARPTAADASAVQGSAPAGAASQTTGSTPAADALRYAYEFRMKEANVSFIRIEHNAQGRGRLLFERLSDSEPITEEFALSPAALERIKGLWEQLDFLASSENYQSEKQYPHLGTVRLTMARGAQQRSADFNWTLNADASQLAQEYRRAAEQSMLVFEIGVALENQPLEVGRLINRMESLVGRGQLSDPSQLLPLLRDISTDERVPLVTRGQVERLIKKIEKMAK